MIFNSTFTKSVTKKDTEIWVRVMDLLLHVGDYLRKFPKEYHFVFECHTIARALAMHIDSVKVVDGHFLGLEPFEGGKPGEFIIVPCDHSWLITPDASIIDPYPVGFMTSNPIVISKGNKYSSWGYEFYQQNSVVTHSVSGRDLSRKSQLLARYMGQAEAEATSQRN